MLFSEVIGQEKLKKHLIESVKQNRVSHCQMFFGPEGSGKLALALAFCQYINCEDKKEGDSCGVCHSCIKYSKLIHPDHYFIFPTANKNSVPKPESVLFIDKFTNFLKETDCYLTLNGWFDKLGIENKQGIINVRDAKMIINALSLKSCESDYKTIIIWMAETLNKSAASKLLKILEEPAEKTVFILISEDIETIIPTVKSRTLYIKVPKIDIYSLKEALISRKGANEQLANKISKSVNGNYIEAIKLLSESDELNINYKRLQSWFRLCFSVEKQFSNLLTLLNEIASLGREKQKQYLIFVLKFLNDLLIYKYRDNNYLTRFEKEEATFLTNFSPYMNQENIIIFAAEINNAHNYIERNANAKILFMDLSLKLNKLLREKK
ncbi:MAG: DNA polymerase III subunit delta [Bacteroidales bacterium]|nr:DNA polymerase III subunit delta [Bacteroidales bacterium]